ncbi:unnamed protein product [Closterium sp. NIES-54]
MLLVKSNRYFLLVVDDYPRYTTFFPLCSKGEVTEVLIDWIRSARRQLSESFGSDLPVLRLHSDRGGEFSSDLLRAFCRTEGIRQTFTLPASPQQNGIAERRIGMVMDDARTSMIHAAAPHFLWPFAILSAILQRTSCPPVPFPASSLASPLTHPGGSSTTPPRVVFCPLTTSRLTSRCLTTVSFPTALPLPPRPPPLFLAPGTPPVDPLPPQGPAPSGVSQVDPAEPVEVAVDSGAARGAEPVGVGTGGAEPGVSVSAGVEPGGAESGSAEPGGAEPARTTSGGPPGAAGAAGAGCAAGAAGAGAAGGASRAAGGAGGAGFAGGAAGGTGAVGGPAGFGATEGAGAAGPGGARTGGTVAAGAGGAVGVGAAGAGAVAIGGASGAGAAGGTGAGGAAGVVAGDPGAEGTCALFAVSGEAARPRPYYVLLHQQPNSPLPDPSPYSGPTIGLTERREPESRPVSPDSRPVSPESRFALPVRTVRAGGRVSRPRPPPVPGTHSMTLHPSTAPQRVPLPSPSASSLPDSPDPESDSLRAASPIITRFLATVVTDPLFESTAASAHVAELVDFAAACRLDFATSLVPDYASASVCPPSVGGECALGTDVLEDRQEEFECFATAVPHLVSMLLAPKGDLDAPDIPTPRSYAEGPYSSQWQAAMDAEMASWKSIDAEMASTLTRFPRLGRTSLHEQIWLRRPPGFTGSFPAGTQWSLRRPVYGLCQAPCEWNDTQRTTLAALGFASSPADPSLFLRTDTTLPLFYVLVYVDDLVFATADTEALAHSTAHHYLDSVTHGVAALPSDKSVEPSGPYLELVGCLMYLMTCTRPDLTYPLSLLARYVAPSRHRKVHWDAAKRVLRYLCSTSGMGLVLGGRARVVLTGHANASWVDDLATQRSSQGYTFSLGSGFVSWWSTRSSSVLSSSCEAEIYAGAMAAQELRWLTYLLTDLGEAPRSPPVMYVNNKAMLALCQEHRL